jgi:non-specific protein-tyrosine kinase
VPHVRRPAPATKDGGLFTPPPMLEPHRHLRVNLDFATGVDTKRVILVSSALAAEGKSTVARNLAFAYADIGARVAVLDVDLRRATMATLLRVTPAPGLVEVIHGEFSARDALQTASYWPPAASFEGSAKNGAASGQDSDSSPRGRGSVDVLVAGSGPVNPSSVLTPENLRPVFASLLEDHDVVLVDAPPLLPVSDALPLLGAVDGVVLVARAGVTTDSAARRVVRTIERISDVNVVGVVVNEIDDELADYGYAYEPRRAKGVRTPEAQSTATSRE